MVEKGKLADCGKIGEASSASKLHWRRLAHIKSDNLFRLIFDYWFDFVSTLFPYFFVLNFWKGKTFSFFFRFTKNHFSLRGATSILISAEKAKKRNTFCGASVRDGPLQICVFLWGSADSSSIRKFRLYFAVRWVTNIIKKAAVRKLNKYHKTRTEPEVGLFLRGQQYAFVLISRSCAKHRWNLMFCIHTLNFHVM